MNREGYSDPTAEKAIANVMREWRRKNAKDNNNNVHRGDDANHNGTSEDVHGGTTSTRRPHSRDKR